MGLKSWFIEANDIVRNDGWLTMFREVLSYLKEWLRFEYREVFLLEYDLTKDTEPYFTPEVQGDIHLHIIETQQQLDNLIADGYCVSSIPMGIQSVKRKFRKGAIACFVFVGYELAHWSWMAMDEKAMRAIEPYPFKIDFSNKELCSGNVGTTEKYRGKGFMPYTDSRRYIFLRENGFKTHRSTVGVHNKSALRAHAKLDYKFYAKGRFIRWLWWRSWKETPIS